MAALALQGSTRPAPGPSAGAVRRAPVGDRRQSAEGDICEVEVAKPGIERWTRHRFDRMQADGGRIDDPGRLLRQILGTPSVNIVSSQT